MSRRTFLALTVIGVYAGTALSWAWPAIARTRMQIIAHHGDLDHWPENTLEAVRGAMALAPDGIEFDVNRSADGTFWLAHDHGVDETTDGAGLLAQLHDDEIRELTIAGGNGFDPDRHHGLRMATMSEALDVLEAWPGLTMVDLKTEGIEAELALVAELAGRVDPARTLVIMDSIEGASALKTADRRFTTLLFDNLTWHPDVDMHLAHGEVRTYWPSTTLADLFGTTCMYIADDFHPADESELLAKADRLGVGMVITNHLEAALAWRDSL